jgi:acyl-coenzyme A synthetase/AMP-(fatty) acid ligase
MTDVKKLADIISDDNAESKLPKIHEDNIAFMVQISGSTGVPKLVAHTHRSVLNLRQTSTWSDVPFDDLTIHYNDRPFTWMGGYPFNFIVGQKRVTVSGFSQQPEDRIAAVIDIISRERCTLLTALPPMLNALISKMVTTIDCLCSNYSIIVIMYLYYQCFGIIT